ncbi:phospholipase D family protein [Rossellomorea yichunensis]|uniref:phospholipase D family protein n=1 Tax=Rossellomorea yichunensis TaxID=3077331 RepID=UPI0028DE9943|nr:phospholipase D family protein [Rossellomorea sp. YC4-1]MDT9026642.1 phospholipase D family protein [Rossellomorea sp. YC4-1]
MKTKKKWYKKKRWWIGGIIVLTLTVVMFYHRVKPLPPGISYAGNTYTIPEKDVEFLYDLTYQKDGKEQYDHSIFNEVYQTIEEAEDFLILDLFLVNGYTKGDRDYPKISEKLSKKIQQQMKKKPDLKVIFISDVVNTTYGSHTAEQLEPLEDLGAEVIYTDLNRLRDPNILYSGVWRTALGWFGQDGYGWLPNPMASSAPKVTMRSYLKLLNVKANHRKVVISENAGLILSANPHDASGFHSNIGFKVKGEILKDMVKAEKAVAAFSGGNVEAFPTEEDLDQSIKKLSPGETSVKAQILTEKKVQTSVVNAMNKAKKGDEVWIGMFYLADRDIIDAIGNAADREVEVRLVLDPNQNAFGQEKIGLPNLPIASELHNLDNDHITIRWYNTNKEQYHTKFIYIKGAKESTVIGGSSNYTSRNLDDYNLEENIKIVAPNDSKTMSDIDQYFNRTWNNKDGTYTVKYEEYQDKLPAFKYVMYILQKIFQVTTY